MCRKSVNPPDCKYVIDNMSGINYGSNLRFSGRFKWPGMCAENVSRLVFSIHFYFIKVGIDGTCYFCCLVRFGKLLFCNFYGNIKKRLKCIVLQ